MKTLPILHLLVITFAWGQSVAQPAKSPVADTLRWYTVSDWGVEGRGWTEVERYYDRLPAKAKGVVREKVWDLSRHSSGMSCRFATDAKEIHVRYTLYSSNLAMPHMPATGVSGVDLYTVDAQGEWRWIATAQPGSQRVSTTLIKEMAGGKRSYLLYLPLYNGLDSLEIGVPVGSHWEEVAPRTEKPLLFYGTSIMHGACASRPGMAIPAILGRRLNKPTINLGFSGNGKLEPEVGNFLKEIEAAVYILDCLPNLTPEETAARAEPFVQLLRAAHPATPILLVEDRVFPNAFVLPERMKNHRARQTALRAAFEKCIADGVPNLYYLPGANLLGTDGDATVDGSHPTDLGMVRYADAYEKMLRKILGREGER